MIFKTNTTFLPVYWLVKLCTTVTRYNNFETSVEAFMPNTTASLGINYTEFIVLLISNIVPLLIMILFPLQRGVLDFRLSEPSWYTIGIVLLLGSIAAFCATKKT